jgi:hypothetical protein
MEKHSFSKTLKDAASAVKGAVKDVREAVSGTKYHFL